jgi:hypothetical protein
MSREDRGQKAALSLALFGVVLVFGAACADILSIEERRLDPNAELSGFQPYPGCDNGDCGDCNSVEDRLCCQNDNCREFTEPGCSAGDCSGCDTPLIRCLCEGRGLESCEEDNPDPIDPPGRQPVFVAAPAIDFGVGPLADIQVAAMRGEAIRLRRAW